MIYYEIVPKTLSNMEQEFHLQICKGWLLLCIWTPWFFGAQNIELHNWMGNIQSTTSHQHKYFPSIPNHFKIPKVKKH